MKRKALTLPLLLLSIVGAVVLLTACGQTCFVGSRVAEAGSYRLDIDRMTGTDCFTMDLRAGDALAVQFETVKGSIYTEIKDPDENAVYAGNGKGATEFTVNISEDGTYSIYVEAHRAKGTVHIQQVDEKKAQRHCIDSLFPHADFLRHNAAH